MGNNSDDDSDFAEYGTALEAIEEDEVARKRPITVAEQVAVDERGRRRFHGAFTGGFSAGYFNTVGSKEGWAPSTFKSSRGDRAKAKGSFASQNVLDFMDEEDKGAFGIAPQILRPTDDFTDKNDSRTRKRPLAKQSEGPIPGVPVLEQIIQPVKETVGIRILIKMGWRPGKGVGPKVQRKAKKPRMEPDAEIIHQEVTGQDDDNEGEEDNRKKMYGCFLPPELTHPGGSDDSDGSEDLLEAEKLLAPDDVSSLLCNPKENSFGLGYKGLDRNALTSASSHVDLFGGAKLKFRMENKHLSISGEAFGVGAFEDNDEDIYSREDMSQYDFALETPEERKRRKAKEEQNKRKGKNKENCIEGFKLSSLTEKLSRKYFPPPKLPSNFEPFHVLKKSRFEFTTPSVDMTEKQETAAKGLGRHTLTISERQVLIEEDVNKIRVESDKADDVNASATKQNDGDQGEKISDPDPPVQSKQQLDADIQHRIERLRKFTQVLQAYTSNKPDENQTATFKPFMKNPEKQERYEKYITLLEAGFSECLRDLQPPDMADWEREREKMEFDRASKLYKPMNSILSSRFTSAKSHDISHLEVEKEAVKEKDPKDDPKVAAKMKLFGKLTHRIMEWHPDKLVCKRFNVPHPYPDSKFVGVKGDPSNRQTSSSSVTSVTQNQAAQPAPKKSLFANLDFSKPPPGLLPPGTTMPISSTDCPMESSEEAGANPILAFQKELSRNAAEDDAEIVPSEAVRPPLDLFKEIFADSSDESEEEDTETPQPSASLQMNPSKKNETSQHSKSEHLPDKSPAIASGDKAPGSDKILSSHYGRKSSLPENERANQKATPSTASYLRRVFDRIDLDKLQDHAHLPGKRSDNEQLSDTILRKSNNDEEGEEEDMYGPLPPGRIPPSSNNATSSRQDPQKPMFIPRGSSSVTPPVSSTVMNYKLPVPSKSQDERTKDGKSEDVVWIEKSALSDRSSRSRVKSKKRSSSAKKSRRKSSKKEKHKSHKSSKSKRQKHKKKGSHKSKGKHSHRHESSSESGSSSGSDEDDSGASSDSSVTINDSLDNRALLAKLKQITRSN